MPRPLKDLFEFGPFRLDAEDGSLRRGEEVVRLPRKAADVLILLVEEPGAVRSRQELMERVWDVGVEPGSLDYQIHLIRRALGKDLGGNDFIETVPRRGFRFVGDVSRIARSAARPSQAPADPDPPPAPSVAPAPVAAPGPRRVSWVGVAAIVGAGGLAALALGAVSSSPSPRIVESRALPHTLAPRLGYSLLTDGGRIYYLPIQTGSRVALPVAGGQSTEVFDSASGLWLADPGRPGIDPLAIRSRENGIEGELWVVPSGSGLPRRVAALTAEDARWSADGRWIALVSNGQIKIVDGEGTVVAVAPKPPGSGSCSAPRWSPDGSTVRFTASFPRDALPPSQAIWEVQRDGSGLRPILADWDSTVLASDGAWSPDGLHFVFQGFRGDRRSDLWVLTEPTVLDGWLGRPPAPRLLTAGPLSITGPVFSRDGTTLYAVGALVQGELVRWDRVSGAFVPYLKGLSGTWVAFSRDGQWVAYVGFPDRKLWRARIDGSERQALVGGEFELDGVAWSPDGRWISFRSRMAGRRMRNFLVPSMGGTPTPVVVEDVEQGIASWSADGTRIVFGDVPAQFGVPSGRERLHVYDLERRELSVVPGSEGLWTARWSPDGRHIMALTIVGQRIKVFDTVTSHWRALDADHVNSPNWSNDSRFIYYDTEGGSFALRRVSLGDGTIQELATLDFLMAGVYGWVGLAPDDSPIALRNLTAPQIYAMTLERER